MSVGSGFDCNHPKITEFSILNKVGKNTSSVQTLGQQPRELRKFVMSLQSCSLSSLDDGDLGRYMVTGKK